MYPRLRQWHIPFSQQYVHFPTVDLSRSDGAELAVASQFCMPTLKRALWSPAQQAWRSSDCIPLIFAVRFAGQNKIVSVGLALIPSNKKLVDQTWRAIRISLMGFATLLLSGCVRHIEFPPMGEPLPNTTKLDISESIKGLILRYTDSCGHLMEIPLGHRVEEALIKEAYRTSKAVVYEGGGSKDAAPDHIVRVDLVNWSFDLNKEYLYDRAPASLQMNAIARVSDINGTVLRETEIKVDRQERLRLEQLAKNCNYIIDPFIQDTVVDFASKVFRDARLAFGGQQLPHPIAQKPTALPGQYGVSAPSSASSTGLQARTPSAPLTPSDLRFKAMLLDENSNLILEGGEHVRVRVDVVNTGASPIQNASATLTGTPSIIGQFPATTLLIPPMRPGETKSLEFIATLPPTAQAQRAEIHVAVTEAGGGAAAPSQTLLLTIQPTGANTDDIDQIPASVSGFQRSHIYLVSIGVGSYLDPRIVPRKYASLDAVMVANYFQTLGGVPPSNIRLLQDWKALRPNIDKALLDWLPPHMTNDAIVIVYFSGQAKVTPTGDVLLVPYEGSPTATTQLYRLKDLESALSRLKAKQTIFLFDGMVSKLHSTLKAKVIAPRWELSGGNAIRLIGGEGFAKGLEDDKHHHGLFTYHLLRGLRGEADTNRDGTVTLGEISGYVRQKVSWAAKSQFNSDQRPQILPSLKPGDPAASLVLSKPAAIAGAETP